MPADVPPRAAEDPAQGVPDEDAPGASADAFAALAQLEGLPATVSSASYETSLEACAADLLDSYRAERGCVPVRSGYLDLLGNLWFCEVQGSGWVDLCFVARAGDERKASELTTIRFERSAWEEVMADAG